MLLLGLFLVLEVKIMDKKELEKEFSKLSDLEFEYKLAKLYCDDEVMIRYAKQKYSRQLKKYLEMEKKWEEVSKKTQDI